MGMQSLACAEGWDAGMCGCHLWGPVGAAVGPVGAAPGLYECCSWSGCLGKAQGMQQAGQTHRQPRMGTSTSPSSPSHAQRLLQVCNFTTVPKRGTEVN